MASDQVGGNKHPVFKPVERSDLVRSALQATEELERLQQRLKTQEEKYMKQVRILSGKLNECVKKNTGLTNYVATLERQVLQDGKDLTNRKQKIKALESKLAELRAPPKKNRTTQTETDTNMHDFIKEIENEKEATLEYQTLLKQKSEIMAGMTEQMQGIESSKADATTKNEKLVKSFFDMFEKIKATDEVLARQQEVVQRQQDAVQRQQGVVQKQQDAVQRQQGVVQLQQDAVQRQQGVVQKQQDAVMVQLRSLGLLDAEANSGLSVDQKVEGGKSNINAEKPIDSGN